MKDLFIQELQNLQTRCKTPNSVLDEPLLALLEPPLGDSSSIRHASQQQFKCESLTEGKGLNRNDDFAEKTNTCIL